MDSGSFNYQFKHAWQHICMVHNFVKDYYMKTEALCMSGELFLQPIKEQRDAEEHIVRAMDMLTNGGVSDSLLEVKLDDNGKQYILKNLNKAFSHKQRALSDTAEWLLLVVKMIVRDANENMSADNADNELRNEDIKHRVIECALRLTSLRCKKDVDEKEFVEEDLMLYREVCQELVDIAVDVRFA